MAKTEFNYALLQAYDFLHLYKSENCVLQMGGADQWGNIVAGIDLIRRMTQGKAYGITFPLITTSSGAKMGKTAKGAVWLDPDRTTPYEYYQFWVNTDDRDVERFLALFTFLPMDEIQMTNTLTGAERNSAKAVLAFEATRLVHGKKQAKEACRESMANFGTRPVPQKIFPSSWLHQEVNGQVDVTDQKKQNTQTVDGDHRGDMAGSFIQEAELKTGIPAFRLFHMVGLAGSRGSARRLIEQGGGYVNGKRLESFDEVVTDKDLQDGQIVLRAGKKRYHRIRLG